MAITFMWKSSHSQVREAPLLSQGVSYPEEGVGYIRSHYPSARLFNQYGWGGYLIYTLYPSYQVFIDGRADVYGESVMNQYHDVVRVKPGWKEVLDQNQVVTYKEIPPAVVNDTKRALIESSIHALENLDKEKRHISMSIRGLSREGYQHFCRRIDELRQEFLDYKDVESCGPVYTLNAQLFPVMEGAERRSEGGEQK